MNRPRTVIAFVNAAHFIDHYAMLIFPAAVIVMAPAFGTTYADLLPHAVPGFVAFGAGSLATGWLGDRWSRRHMMVVFFLGTGVATASVGLVRTPGELGAALFALGAFASIYHPVGTAMLVARAERLGHELGTNGVWGNLGVASSALVTGGVCQWLGWRWAFVLPGLVAVGTGLWFMGRVGHEPHVARAPADGAVRVPRARMRRVVAALALTVIASSTAFNAVTVALPALFSERLAALATDPAIIGLVVAGTYLFGALAQYTIGGLLDRRSLKAVFLPLSFLTAPLLVFAAGLSGPWLVLASIGIVIGLFGQVTINDAMVGRYTDDAWRSRAYAIRYFVGFTAAGVSVGAVARLHERGGFELTLQSLGALCTLVIVGAVLFPSDEPEA